MHVPPPSHRLPRHAHLHRDDVSAWCLDQSCIGWVCYACSRLNPSLTQRCLVCAFPRANGV